MLSSSRFVVATHAMCLLALRGKDGIVCSSELASHVDTNAVVIRRLMGQLERTGLVKSESGRLGGFRLAKSARDISLACIYAAVEDEQVFRQPRGEISESCETARSIYSVLMPKLTAASKSMTESLRGVSLADLLPTKSKAVA